MQGQSPQARKPRRRSSGLWRLFSAAFLLVALAIALSLGLDRQLSLDALASHRAALTALVNHHPLASLAGYGLIYTATVALSLPGAVILTLAGGLLFGVIAGTIAAVLGATCGAILVFLAARSAFGAILRDRATPWLARMERGFQANAISYLLFLRLVPVFPFWLVNLVPALFGIRLLPFAITTLIGILPGSLVYVSLGAGMGDLLDRGGRPDPGIILSPSILLPLLALAVLSLLPVWFRRRGGGNDQE